MAIRQQPLEYDPFAAPIPGQSFAEAPGLSPYERPAISADPEQVVAVLEESLEDEETEQQIVDMLEIGVSAETITEALLNKCFAEGVCTPDVSELVKPFIFMKIVQIGIDNGIDDMELLNDPEADDEKGMSTEQKLSLMSRTNPGKYNDIQQMNLQEDEEEPLTEEEMYAMDSDNDMPSETGSFLDMEPSAYEAPAEEEEEGLV